jgi:hypothetical protein
MNYLVWRQHRNQAAVAAATLAALVALLIPTGLRVADQFRSARGTCASVGTCGNLDAVFSGYGVVLVLLGMTLAVPCLLGLFWGAPLLAREFEAGTHRLVWTQTVTRRRWLAVKLGWMLLAAVIVGAAVGGLVSWWSRPANSFYEYRFQLGHFDTQGVVPIGYAVFAVALGVLAGAILRRLLPALAATLAGFLVVRFAVDYLLRPHYLKPLTNVVPFTGGDEKLHGSAWTISRMYIDPSGHASRSIRIGPDTLPSACQGLFPKPGLARDPLAQCLGAHGWRVRTTYQPAGRFWTFQLIELALYVGLAAALVALTFWAVRRTDG